MQYSFTDMEIDKNSHLSSVFKKCSTIELLVHSKRLSDKLCVACRRDYPSVTVFVDM